MAESSPSVLIVIRHSPYGSMLGKAAIDIAMAAGAFEQAPTLLFVGDGVLQLMPDQNTKASGHKSIAKHLASFPLFDIDSIFADAEACQHHGIDLQVAPCQAEMLNDDGIHSLMSNHQHVLSL